MDNGRIAIGEFSLSDTIACGAAIRHLGRRGEGEASFATALLHYLRQRFTDDDGASVIVLARLFKTSSYRQLDPELQALVRKSLAAPSPDMQCLRLFATVGSEPAWNDIRQSVGHRVIPLPSEEAVEQLPMIAQLLQQLEFDVGGVVHSDARVMVRGGLTGVFHVEEALGSIHIPAQDEFVRRFGIRSVIGFGDVLPDGNIFAVIMFSRVTIPQVVADLFSLLSVSVRSALLSWCPADGAGPMPENRIRQPAAPPSALGDPGVEVADHAGAGLDRAVVLELAGDNEALVSELIETFLEEGPRLLAEIDCALANGDADQLQNAAHTLKGSAVLFAAQPTVDTARELERCAMTEFARAEEIAGRLHEEFERLREALLHWDRELGGQP